MSNCEDRDRRMRLQKARTWSGDENSVSACDLKGPGSLWHWVEIENYRDHPIEGDIVGEIAPKPHPGAKFVTDLIAPANDDRWEYKGFSVDKAQKGWLRNNPYIEKEKFVALEATGHGGKQEVRTSIAVKVNSGKPPVPFRTLRIVVDT